jgi:hypothetical protein
MKTIVLSPWSKMMPDNRTNAKNYHRWVDVVSGLKLRNMHVIQVGLPGESIVTGVDETRFGLRFSELETLVRNCTTWCSVDNFFHHFCAFIGKPGVVVWGKSDPLLFGHSMHTNIVNRDKLRPLQFELWKNEPFDPTVFPEPHTVIDAVIKMACS